MLISRNSYGSKDNVIIADSDFEWLSYKEAAKKAIEELKN
jgi:hypothetical protein